MWFKCKTEKHINISNSHETLEIWLKVDWDDSHQTMNWGSSRKEIYKYTRNVWERENTGRKSIYINYTKDCVMQSAIEALAKRKSLNSRTASEYIIKEEDSKRRKPAQWKQEEKLTNLQQ